MGSSISQLPDKAMKRERFEVCQSIILQDVLECYVYYKDHYKDRPTLASDEFEDIFSPILSNTIEHFDMLEVNGAVMVKEALGPLLLFSKGLLDEKLEWLIRVYEKEDNKMIKEEIIELIQHTARGIWKMMFDAGKERMVETGKIMVNIPSYMELEEFARKEFPEIAEVKVKYINRDAIMNWFKKSEEIQELLFILTDTQTYERAKKSFFNFLEKARKAFNTETVEFMDERFAPIGTLKKVFDPTFPQISSKVKEHVFEILEAKGTGITSEDEYMSIMQALAAFQSTDVKNKGVLGKNSVKTLIWLLNGKEPNDKKVLQEITLIPWTNSEITINDWIQYLSCTNHNNIIVDSKAKEYFDIYDKNGDGKLDSAEFAKFLENHLRSELFIKSEAGEIGSHAKKVIYSFAKELMGKLDTGKKGYLNWIEFKEYKTAMAEQKESLLTYLYSLS